MALTPVSLLGISMVTLQVFDKINKVMVTKELHYCAFEVEDLDGKRTAIAYKITDIVAMKERGRPWIALMTKEFESHGGKTIWEQKIKDQIVQGTAPDIDKIVKDYNDNAMQVDTKAIDKPATTEKTETKPAEKTNKVTVEKEVQEKEDVKSQKDAKQKDAKVQQREEVKVAEKPTKETKAAKTKNTKEPAAAKKETSVAKKQPAAKSKKTVVRDLDVHYLDKKYSHLPIKTLTNAIAKKLKEFSKIRETGNYPEVKPATKAKEILERKYDSTEISATRENIMEMFPVYSMISAYVDGIITDDTYIVCKDPEGKSDLTWTYRCQFAIVEDFPPPLNESVVFILSDPPVVEERGERFIHIGDDYVNMVIEYAAKLEGTETENISISKAIKYLKAATIKNAGAISLWSLLHYSNPGIQEDIQKSFKEDAETEENMDFMDGVLENLTAKTTAKTAAADIKSAKETPGKETTTTTKPKEIVDLSKPTEAEKSAEVKEQPKSSKKSTVTFADDTKKTTADRKRKQVSNDKVEISFETDDLSDDEGKLTSKKVKSNDTPKAEPMQVETSNTLMSSLLNADALKKVRKDMADDSALLRAFQGGLVEVFNFVFPGKFSKSDFSTSDSLKSALLKWKDDDHADSKLAKLLEKKDAQIEAMQVEIETLKKTAPETNSAEVENDLKKQLVDANATIEDQKGVIELLEKREDARATKVQKEMEEIRQVSAARLAECKELTTQLESEKNSSLTLVNQLADLNERYKQLDESSGENSLLKSAQEEIEKLKANYVAQAGELERVREIAKEYNNLLTAFENYRNSNNVSAQTYQETLDRLHQSENKELETHYQNESLVSENQALRNKILENENTLESYRMVIGKLKPVIDKINTFNGSLTFVVEAFNDIHKESQNILS